MSADTVSMTSLSANLVLIFLSLFSSSISLVCSFVRCYCLVHPIKVEMNLFTFDRTTCDTSDKELWKLMVFTAVFACDFICSQSNDVNAIQARVQCTWVFRASASDNDEKINLNWPLHRVIMNPLWQ